MEQLILSLQVIVLLDTLLKMYYLTFIVVQVTVQHTTGIGHQIIVHIELFHVSELEFTNLATTCNVWHIFANDIYPQVTSTFVLFLAVYTVCEGVSESE